MARKLSRKFSNIFAPKQDSTHELTANEKILLEQSIPVDGDPVVRRSPLSDKLESVFYDDVTTVYEGFLRGCRVSGGSPCLGKRGPNGESFQWLTYDEVHARAHHFGSGLVHLGSQPSQETFIGIHSQNCIEWDLADLACQMFSMISVPIYDTHGPEASLYIIDHAVIEATVCHPSKLSFLIDNVHSTPKLKRVITIGEVSEKEVQDARQAGLQVFSFAEVEDTGRENQQEKNPPKPNDIFTISYTSGTTGTPKGVIQTHGNQIAAVTSLAIQAKAAGFSFSQDDRHLSFLPLAHVYERITHTIFLQSGARIGFFRGDIKLILEDLQELKPTLFGAVPRLLNKIYDKVMSQVSESKFKSWLFNKALRSKEADLNRNIIRDDTIWDKVVFKKVRMLFGGQVRVMTSGAAPLSSKVMMFFKCAMGNCLVTEAYGQTETTAACTAQLPKDFTAGHVGSPLACNHIKLVDVPEKNYFTTDLKGEICVKGPNVTPGYYKQPEKTAELFDKDGWMHTGDIGMILENGALKIIDRTKDIFKLAQGEYVAPGKLENIIQRSPFVAQAFVHGESLKTYVVAIIVPDEEVLMKWAKQKGTQGDFKMLCETEEVRKAIFDDALKVSKEAKLNGFEQAKAIHLHHELFSVENGLLTATFKTKRPAVLATFQEEISNMYARIEDRPVKPSQSEIEIQLQIDQGKLQES